MAYYDNPGKVNDEAINISGGKTFQVIQLADIAGNITESSPSLLSSLIYGFTYPSHNSVEVNRTSGRVTSIVHKSGSTTVSTLNITYNGNGEIASIAQVL